MDDNRDYNEYGDVADVTNSTAYLSLDTLLEEGRLPEDRVNVLKQKFKELHDRVLQIYTSDNYLLKKARQLRKDLDQEREKVAKCGEDARDDDATIFQLKKELAAAETELSAAQEKESMLQVEALELERKKHNLHNELVEKEEEEENAMRPILDGLETQIHTLGQEIERAEEEFRCKKDEREDLVRKEADVREKIAQNEKLIADLNLEVSKIDREPERARKQADIVSKALQTTQKEVRNLMEKLTGQGMLLKDQEERMKALEVERYEEQLKLEREKNSTESRAKLKLRVLESLKGERLTYEQCVNKNAELETSMKNLQTTFAAERERLQKAVKEKDQSLKHHKRLEAMIIEVQKERDMYTNQIEILQRELAHIASMRKQAEEELDELKRDVDILINNFLKEELEEKRTIADKEQLMRRIVKTEGDVNARAQEEIRNAREVARLSVERERASRECSRNQTKVLEARNEIKVKEVIIRELEKRNKELQARLENLTDQYTTVKRERSDKAYRIQEATQQMSETQEKIKILENELEVLRRESQDKDKTLAKLRRSIHDAEKQREKQRMEANSRFLEFKSKRKLAEDKGTEIEKLNDVITTMEKELLDLKKKYEDAVENRNFTGIQLIDRNDELCILYEKCNIQENILKNGEVMLKQKEEQIRAYAIEMADLQREIDICQKTLPQLQDYEEDLESTMGQLEEERMRIEVLEEDVVDPKNRQRWRKLGFVQKGSTVPVVSAIGSNPPKIGDVVTNITGSETPEDIDLRVKDLEQKLCQANEKLMEKDLILEEVSTLANKLRQQAVSGREYTLALAMKVNDFQHSIKKKTKKMMATLSELSIVQASAIRVEMDVTDLESQVLTAKERVEQGLPPTETLEAEIQRETIEDQRRRETVRKMKEKQAAEASGMRRTTAEQRPNAYIPVDGDLAIPRPYGAHAPFHPTMEVQNNVSRFYRKQVLKELDFDDD
eukprot:PhM_4_TR8578/c0_g1_i1/m.39088